MRHALVFFYFFAFHIDRFIGVLTSITFMADMTLKLFRKSVYLSQYDVVVVFPRS